MQLIPHQKSYKRNKLKQKHITAFTELVKKEPPSKIEEKSRVEEIDPAISQITKKILIR